MSTGSILFAGMLLDAALAWEIALRLILIKTVFQTVGKACVYGRFTCFVPAGANGAGCCFFGVLNRFIVYLGSFLHINFDMLFLAVAL